MDFNHFSEITSDFPIYKKLSEGKKSFPILKKTDISGSFPEGWLNDKTKRDLSTGKAEYVTTTGTHHDRMSLIRPPFFLMKQYFKIWSEHLDLSPSWDKGCMRISLTTIRATQHVTKAKKPTVKDRTFAGRCLYINTSEDPEDWQQDDLERMLKEIKDHSPYHLDGDANYIACLIRKLKEHNLWDEFPKPETLIHAYEFCTKNVSLYIRKNMQCPVVNLYGSTEVGFLFSTTVSSPMRSYFDDLKMELHQVNKQDNIFSLIVTSLRNPYMPLIRYRTGDCLETSDKTPNPEKITRISGREADLLPLEENRFLSHAQFDDLIHQKTQNIFLYQLQKMSTNNLVLSYTSFDENPLDKKNHEDLKQTLESRLRLPCDLQWLKNIAPIKSGKYKWLKGV